MAAVVTVLLPFGMAVGTRFPPAHIGLLPQFFAVLFVVRVLHILVVARYNSLQQVHDMLFSTNVFIEHIDGFVLKKEARIESMSILLLSSATVKRRSVRSREEFGSVKRSSHT